MRKGIMAVVRSKVRSEQGTPSAPGCS